MLYLSNAFEEIVRIWADISLKSPSAERTVLVPAERITHAFRREIASNPDWRSLLIGTRFMRPVRFAADILLLAGKPALPGAENVEPVMLEELFDGHALQGKLKYFDIEQLRTGAGFADAFARTFDDLRAAGVDSAALRAAAKSATDQISRGRFLDLAAVLDSLNHPYADRHKILRDAAKVVARPAGRVFACLLRHPDESELEFLSAVPNLDAAFLTANPRRLEEEERLKQMAARLRGLAPESRNPPASETTELCILKKYLFAAPDELGRKGRPVSKGPDRTVHAELHGSLAEEIAAAVDWVCDCVTGGTRLERIAIIVPESDPLSGMLYSRLARLPWPADDPPVHVAGGLPVTDIQIGQRFQALILALQNGLRVDEFFRVLPFLQFDKPVGKFENRHLTLSDSMEIVWVCGTLGGSPARPEGAAEWVTGFERRIAHLEELVKLTDASEKLEREVRNAKRYLDPMKAVLPAVRSLVNLAEMVSRGESLDRLWPAMKSFWKNFTVVFDNAGVFNDLDDSIIPFLSLNRTGNDALAVIHRQIRSLRRSVGRFGEARIFIGTPDKAAGIPFDAVRIMGLAEGSVGGAASDDPLLPDADRLLLNHPIRLAAHQPLASIQNIHRIVSHAKESIIFSAPRQTLDGTVHEPSSLFLEIAAALRRPNAETVKFDPKYLRSSAVRRDYFGPGRIARDGYFKMLIPRSDSKDIAEFLAKAAAPNPGPLDGFLRSARLEEKPLSATALRTMMECPRRYLFEKVIGWGEPSELPDINNLDAMTYGSLFHAVMESFFKKCGGDFYKSHKSLDQWLDAAKVEACLQFAALVRFYPLVGENNRSAQRERLERDVESVIRFEWNRKPMVRIGGIEKSFGVAGDLNLSGLLVKGIMDRIDVVGGKSFVRDFKTGKPHFRKQDDPPDPVLDIQLAVYALALGKTAADMGVPPPVGAGYMYVSSQVPVERSYIGGDFDVLLKHGKEWLELAAGLLKEGTFPHTVNKKDCERCPFKPVCGDNRVLAEEKMKAGGGAAAKFFALRKPPEKTFDSGKPKKRGAKHAG